MSALESPPTLTSTWQDPWSAVTSGSIPSMTASTASDVDFYNTGKTQMPAFGMYPQIGHHHHSQLIHQNPHNQYNNPMMGHNHHGGEAGHQHNNNNSMNSDANSSSSAASTASTKKADRRQVNFKLDIKSEPLEPINNIGQDMCQNNNPGMQKVPSISDLSDPESSLDIPLNHQV